VDEKKRSVITIHLNKCLVTQKNKSIYGHRLVFPSRNRNQHFAALKAPPETSPGQRPGFRIDPIGVRPERAQGVLPPFQGG
jgi:hypothetical protein